MKQLIIMYKMFGLPGGLQVSHNNNNKNYNENETKLIPKACVCCQRYFCILSTLFSYNPD